MTRFRVFALAVLAPLVVLGILDGPAAAQPKKMAMILPGPVEDADFNALECPAFAAGNLGSLGRLHRRSDYVPVVFNQVLPDGSTRSITRYRFAPGVSKNQPGRS